jgi:phenylacetic acid degradation protein
LKIVIEMEGIYEFGGYRPVVHETAFVHPRAVVTGNVIIGRNVYIGVQVLLEESAHVGHGAIIHGAHLGKNCLIGMNAVIMDRAVIGEGSIIGALSFVAADTIVPPRTIFAGNPAKAIKEVSDEMLTWKTEGTAIYQRLPEDCRNSLRPCEPMREVPADRGIQAAGYQPWKS